MRAHVCVCVCVCVCVNETATFFIKTTKLESPWRYG